MFKRVLILLLSSIFFPQITFSQKEIASELTFYIKYVYSDDSKYVKKIPIGYDLFYPMYQPVTKWVTLKRENIIAKIKVKNNNITIDGNFLLIENGDTLYTKVEKRNEHITFTNQNDSLLFYSKIWQYDFSKRKPIYPTSRLNDPNFSLNFYKNYCHEYFIEERRFIDSLFKDKRPRVKERLSNTSKNNELLALITPFISRKILDQELKNEIDSIVYKEKIRLNHVQPGYILDPSYRNALSQINLIQAGLIIENEITPFDYNALYENAIKSFSKDTYTFLLITYLRRIVRSSNGSYKLITDRIYNQLKSLGLSNKLKYQIDSLYKDFALLITNVKLFQNVYLKKSNGQNLQMKNVLDSQRPILFDFWASWCAPCLVEFPYLDSIKKDFPDLQIVSLSIDTDESKWIKFMKKNENWDNASFLLKNPNQSLIVRKYKIEFVPRFMLYDKSGNCLSLDFLRPSDKGFTETMRKLLYGR